MSTPTSYQAWLNQASHALKPLTDSARLDAELLLCHLIKKPRSYLFAWPEKTLSAAELDALGQLLQRRLHGEPVAYLVGEKEFWSLPLRVNPQVLQPRPETEYLVEAALECTTSSKAKVLDLGTGSGAIACALASERPQWQITATDQSEAALSVAAANAQHLGLRIEFLHGHWFQALEPDAQPFDTIVSNPPYIADNDPHLKGDGTRFEPRSALVAPNNGLADLYHIIAHASAYLASDGWLWLEHGYDQAQAVAEHLRVHGFRQRQHRHDGQHLRLTGAQRRH